MKNKILIWALFLMTVFAACENEYVAPGPPLTDFNLYTSQFRNTLGYKIGVNDFISFADLSQGELSHTWTIPETCVFLEGSITRQDSIFDKFMIPGKETTKKTIHVLFTKPGIQPVRLYDTFKDSVSYRTAIPYPAKKIGDKWVIDTTFMVDVYDTLAPLYKIVQNGVDVPNTKDTIYVEAGGSLTFVDMTVQGRPDTRAWKIGTESAKDSVATIVFKKLGAVTGTFAASRTNPDIPGGYKMVKISSVIKVIPSTKPWILSGIVKELENQTIQLPFNGEFLPFLNKNSFFKVKVNGTEFAISSIGINATDKTLLEIKLAEPIYRPDVITISLLAGSGIQSGDYRTISPFENIPVKMYDFNFIPFEKGFEEGTGLWVKGTDDFGTGQQGYSTIDPATGAYCYHMSVVDDTKRTSAINPNTFSLVKGKTYILEFKMKVVSRGPAGGVEVRLNRGGVIDDRYAGNWTGYPAADGKWYTKTVEFTYTDDAPTLGIQILLYKVIDCYFDDLIIHEKEVRP